MCSQSNHVHHASNENEEIVQELPPQSYADLSRRDLRALIFHLLYAMEAYEYDISLSTIVDNLNHGFDLDIPQESEVVRMAYAIIQARDQLDSVYQPLLTNWRFERVSVCTKLILRLAIWELQNTDTDSRIVINEAIELAKCFAEQDSYRFINGILDRIFKNEQNAVLVDYVEDGAE
jgi:transcription antitermination protein NusB